MPDLNSVAYKATVNSHIGDASYIGACESTLKKDFITTLKFQQWTKQTREKSFHLLMEPKRRSNWL